MRAFILASVSLAVLAAPTMASARVHHPHKIRRETLAPSAGAYQAYQPIPVLQAAPHGRCYGDSYNYSWGECGTRSGGPSGAPNQGG